MDFEFVKNFYEGVVVINKSDAKILYSYAKEPFEDFAVKNIADLDAWFAQHYSDTAIPLFDKISKGKDKSWIIRKSKHEHICYYILECRYWDAVLENADKKSTLDGLTGAYNKKEIEEQLTRNILSYLRYKKNSFSVIMFDIDFFKKVNDTYGHLAGDYVLKEISALTKSIMRNSDIFGRFGGEEFMLILPETKVAGAIKFANRLRSACEEHKFIFNNQEMEIRISLGVTSVTKTDSPAALIDRCDTALYDAKKNGRKRVEYR